MATYSAYSDVVSGTTFQSELGTYISGLATPLSSTQLGLLNTFIIALKAGMGISVLSDVFDCLWILAGETEESSLRNIIKDSFHCTKSGLPTWTQYEGYACSTAKYLNTNYNPATPGVRFLQDDNGFGCYERTSRAYSSSKWAMGAADGISSIHTIIPFRTSVTARGYSNNTAAVTITVADNLGFTHVNRYASNAIKGGRNKSLTVAETTASAGVTNLNQFIGCYNAAGVATNPEDAQISMAWYSKSLISAGSQANMDCLIDAFEAYMDARGNGVII